MAPRRRGVRRLRGADRARPRGAAPGSSSPTRSRSTRTSGSTSRIECGCLLVRDGARCCDAAFEIAPDYLRDARPHERRGQLRRPRAAADADVARAEALGVAAVPSASTRSAPRSTARSTCAERGAAAGRGEPGARARGPPVARHRLLPAALRRRRRGADARTTERRARRRARAQRARARLLDAAARPLRDPALSSTTRRPPRTSSASCASSRRPSRSRRRRSSATATSHGAWLRRAASITARLLGLPLFASLGGERARARALARLQQAGTRRRGRRAVDDVARLLRRRSQGAVEVLIDDEAVNRCLRPASSSASSPRSSGRRASAIRGSRPSSRPSRCGCSSSRRAR